MKTRLFLLLLLLLATTKSSHAAEMLLNGMYRGTNIYVQNPQSADKSYCISEIYINNKKISFEQKAEIEINLSHLKQNSLLTIKIIHKDDCTPKVQNLNAIKAKEGFQFLTIEAKPDKILWETKGEKKFGKFFVEVYKNSNWVSDKVYNGLGQATSNKYEAPITHSKGTNRYRIKYLEISGKSVYSEDLLFEVKE